jgi:hypothetical protein
MGMKLRWLALPLLAACASTVDWSKPGATQAEIDADIGACRRAAQGVPTLPRLQTAPSGAVSQPTGTDLDADRQMQEAQRVQECMQKRGYRLVAK